MNVKVKIVNPVDYFADWHYSIPECFWSGLGVERREYVDKQKTIAARKRACSERNLTTKEAAQIRITFFAYAVSKNPHYDFHQGDVFYSKGDAIQISLIVNGMIEIYRFVKPHYVYACRVTQKQLVEWLRFGVEPHGSKVDKFSSWREITKYSLIE